VHALQLVVPGVLGANLRCCFFGGEGFIKRPAAREYRSRPHHQPIRRRSFLGGRIGERPGPRFQFLRLVISRLRRAVVLSGVGPGVKVRAVIDDCLAELGKSRPKPVNSRSFSKNDLDTPKCAAASAVLIRRRFAFAGWCAGPVDCVCMVSLHIRYDDSKRSEEITSNNRASVEISYRPKL